MYVLKAYLGEHRDDDAGLPSGFHEPDAYLEVCGYFLGDGSGSGDGWGFLDGSGRSSNDDAILSKSQRSLWEGDGHGALDGTGTG